MAAGLPAVATDVGDSARIVGATGGIVPSREPVALAEAVGALLGESKTARDARGVGAHRRIETRFSIARGGCPPRVVCLPDVTVPATIGWRTSSGRPGTQRKMHT